MPMPYAGEYKPCRHTSKECPTYCHNYRAPPTKGAIGWVCPNCQAGLSPYTDRCPCRPMPPQYPAGSGVTPLTVGPVARTENGPDQGRGV